MTVAVRRSRWTMVWCRPQSRAALLRSVGPPSTQCLTWWASHHDAGVWQPGKVQCRSRSHSACTCAGVKSRLVRPRSRTCPSASRTAGMTAASQASFRTVSGPSSAPRPTRPGPHPGPGPSRRSSTPMVTRTVAFTPDGVPRSRACRRCGRLVGTGRRGRRRGVGRWSVHPARPAVAPRLRLGGGGGVDGGFDDGAGFGVEPEPVLGDVAADVVPAGQHGQTAVPVLDLLQHADPGRTGPAAPAGPGGPRPGRRADPSPPARPPPRRPRPVRSAGSAGPARTRPRTPPTPTGRPSATAARAPANQVPQ